ncbi:MAG: alpha-glucosidase [Anaerolineales bacterium]|nr:alpha-glucosidase [Anaerolineales bacterium]
MTPWYHKTTIYQIYPRSFFDSNGDGVGDLRGVIQKLDYVKELGFESVWLSPFFTSPQRDFGYDISDYRNVAPEYGTLDDALELIEEVHKRGMRIVFDMVMNHTSDEHPWFRESRASRDNPKADWYIWRDKPTNWNSLPGGNGWYYAPERGQYYWASFLSFQPDLNYRNPEVKRIMLDTVRFWLAKGVDGFRLDVFNAIYKDEAFRDNPFSPRFIPTENDPSGFFQQAKYNLNLPESFEFAREFRAVCDEFGERLSLGEVSGSRATIRKYLGGTRNDGLTLVFDFAMLNFRFDADYFRRLLLDLEAAYPDPFMPVYVFSNHDRRRSMTRLGGDVRKAKLLAIFQLTARGVPCMYYGEEIGMTDLTMPFASALDPVPHKYKYIPRFVFDLLGLTINRDEARTPMQWDATRDAGFSSAEKTWLPVHPNHREVNAAAQIGDEASQWNAVRGLLKLRSQETALHAGSLNLIESLPSNVLGYARVSGDERVHILLNFDRAPIQFSFADGDCLFKLNENDRVADGVCALEPFGGIVLKSPIP